MDKVVKEIKVVLRVVVQGQRNWSRGAVNSDVSVEDMVEFDMPEEMFDAKKLTALIEKRVASQSKQWDAERAAELAERAAKSDNSLDTE